MGEELLLHFYSFSRFKTAMETLRFCFWHCMITQLKRLLQPAFFFLLPFNKQVIFTFRILQGNERF
jgi:hypothetical protein